jgi:uncharacterized protein YggE
MKQQLNVKRIVKNGAVFFAAIFFIANVHAQDKPVQRTISVSGSAEMEVVPDEIYVQVDLREYDKKGAGKIDIETIKNNFLTACKSIGLNETDISVQSFSGTDNVWYYKKSKKANPDMKATISYWVKLSNTKKMNELVDKLDDEATQNFFIAKVSHSKMETFKKQLKIEAVKAAKEKAVYLSEAIDEHVGEAITINEPADATNYPQPRVYAANAVMKYDRDESAMNVDFKKIKLQYEVNVVFALK